MRNKKTALYLLSFLSLVFFSLNALLVYRFIMQKRNILGAQYVTRLNKEDYMFPSVGSFKHFYEPKPDTVIHDKPDWLGYTATYTINHDGLNERFDYPVGKPANSFRIMTIGDSFSFGLFVDTKDNFSERLEDMLNANLKCRVVKKFDVINLGVAAYDIAYTVQRYINRGEKYHPDLIIWLINDHNLLRIEDLLAEREIETTRSMSESEKQKYYDEKDPYKIADKATADILSLLGMNAVMRQQKIYLNQFSQLYQGPLLIIPRIEQDDDKAKKLINQFVQQRPRTVMDNTLPDLKNINSVLRDGHPTGYGHLQIASHLYEYLRSKRLLSCN